MSVISKGTAADAATLEAAIPELDEPYGQARIEARLGDRPHLCLVARVDGELAGYKVGYAETPERFYSWIGGVAPAHRRRGIAQELLEAQEAWCREQGYEVIIVKSQNRFRSMVALLIRNAYDIFAVQANGVIIFRKALR